MCVKEKGASQLEIESIADGLGITSVDSYNDCTNRIILPKYYASAFIHTMK